MNTYTIYRHPTRGMEAVKHGFSWPAFFFGWIWMLVKHLWRLGLLWFVLSFVLGILEAGSTMGDPEASATDDGLLMLISIGWIAMWLVPAFKGNEWRRNNLAKRGFEVVMTVDAQTPDVALAKIAAPAASALPVAAA